MNCRIEFLYKSAHSEAYSIAMHSHNCYEAVYYRVGRGTVSCKGQTFKYSNGSVVVVEPNTLHDENGEISGENVVIGFKIFADENFELKTGAYFADSKVVGLFESVLAEFSCGKAFYKEIAEARLCELVCLLLRGLENEKKEDFSNVLKNIENYLEENLSLPLRLNDFAATYHYSESRFRHLFAEKTGISLKRYVMKKRFKRAESLLINTKKSVTEIALECGFYDSAQFAKLFKAKNGCSPKRFRSIRGV